MTKYRSGRELEWAIRDDLTTDGYWTMRAAGSKGKVDILAIKPGQVLMVQAKNTGKIGPAERAELLRIAALLPDVAVPLVAYRTGRPWQVTYARLTGPGPRDRVAWSAEGDQP